MTRIKLRSARRGGHVHTALFIAHEQETAAKAGDLVLTVGEYQILAAALYAARDAWSFGALIVEEEGVLPIADTTPSREAAGGRS